MVQYTAVLGFFLAIEGGVHMGKEMIGVVIGVVEHWQQRRNLRN